MPFYASQFVGTGTYTDPFQPIIAGLGVEWQMVDVRPDQTKVDGWCVAWTPNALTTVPSGVRLLATTPDDVLPPAVISYVKNTFGVGIPAGTTTRRFIRALLKFTDADPVFLGSPM